LKNGTTIEYRTVDSASIQLVANLTIVYQANPVGSDRFSHFCVSENGEFGSARTLQAGRGLSQIPVCVTRVAHEFRRAFWKDFEEIEDAIARENASLGDAAEIVCGFNAGLVGEFVGVAREQLQATGLDALFEHDASILARFSRKGGAQGRSF